MVFNEELDIEFEFGVPLLVLMYWQILMAVLCCV